MDLTPCLIDDFGPLPVVQPSSVAEVGECVRRAAADSQALYPLGGRTALGLGLPPDRPGVGVDLHGLAGVIDYPARDMTITVQAGITLARLQEVLAGENQRLPVEVPRAAQATLGGALAVNASGPRRFGFGTLGHYVIGISAVNDEGQEIKGGGRVVKNVAGYDLCKLFVGSLGTLGIITQATLKVKPRPEEQALLTLGCHADALDGLLEQLHRSRTWPVCVEVLNEAAARALNRGGLALPEAPWVLVVGFEDNRDTVSWQVQQLIKEFPGGNGWGFHVLAGTVATPLRDALCEGPASPESVLAFKANLLPRAVADFCQRLVALREGVLVQAHAGNGIVQVQVPGDLTPDGAAAMLKTVLDAAVAGQGNVVLTRCPPAWKKTLPVWGAPRGDAWLMRRVKEKLDPRRLFNPGRFVDGI